MRLKDDNKAQIIRRKAIEMIVKEGFDGLSMQKLAKSAKISPSTIYIYFENREDLLNKLFMETEADFEKDALRNFDPGIPFEEGLWLQWKNRYKNITKDPLRFYFHEQFRNSPLIKHKDIKQTEFRKNISQFVKNAVARKEIAALPQEIFWAIAYGPFYTLIKFHLDESTMAGTKFSLTEQKMKQAFQLVMKSLKS
ncbi:MAG: transcriptional regulator, TetR family [Bacteroidetes bacterium]|nr:transcriptional regulator, TetR family [Bacteroidota bacterium]